MWLLYHGFDGMQNWTLNLLALSSGQCLRASSLNGNKTHCERRVVVNVSGEYWLLARSPAHLVKPPRGAELYMVGRVV